MHYSPKWRTVTTVNSLPWRTIKVFNFFTTTQEHIPLKVYNHAQIHTSWPQNSVAETFVAVICNQLSTVPYIFKHCDLLDLNKIHEKKLQVNNDYFTDCHTEGLVNKAN